MKIITGKTLTEHVNSEDDRGLYAGILGSGSYVLNTGTQFKATIESSNTIRIDSGDLVHQGCHARIPYDEYDEVTIDSCTSGCRRIDIIAARYSKQSGIEAMELYVIKGTESISDPIQPSYSTGNILNGASESYMPLYLINLNNQGGSTSVTVSSMFTVISTMNDRYNKQEIDEKTNQLLSAVKAAQETANQGVSKANEAIPQNAVHSATVNLHNHYLDTSEMGSTMDSEEFLVVDFTNTSILLCTRRGSDRYFDGNIIDQVEFISNDEAHNIRIYYDSTLFGSEVSITLYWMNI